VVGRGGGWFAVGEPAPLERVAAELDAERRGALLPGGAALAPQRLDEGPVLREEVVVLERRRLLELGLPIDTVDSQGCSALLRAAGGGHLPVIDVLLQRGANVALAAEPERDELGDGPVVMVENGAPIDSASSRASVVTKSIRTVRLRRSASTVPKSTDGLRSSRNQAVISRSSLYSRTYGVSIRAVTFQSMYRTSSPGWYSRSAARSTPLPWKRLR